MKVLADYLLFDQHREKMTFPRFEECMGLLMRQRKDILLKDVYIDICGQSKKYITFPRLVKAFCEFKMNDSKKSLHFKNFFSYVFTEVLRVKSYINF